jgi:MYXO-CTERM domain-containing protein
MNKASFGAALSVLAAFAGSAAAQDISTVNGYNVHLRNWNDFPGSTLNWGSAASASIPAPVPATAALPGFGGGLRFQETFPTGTPGNFANQHYGLFSNDGGATPFGLNNHQSFTVNTDITITTPAGGPRKEGGLKFYNDRGNGFIDEGEVLVASENGEVAVFGAAMNFTGFGVGAYTPGTTAHLSFQYIAPGINSFYAAYRVVFTDAVTGVHDSGIVDFDHGAAVDPNAPANGFNSGSKLGFLDQNQRNPFGDSVDVIYGNPSVVPTPGALALLGLAGFSFSRRRR